MKLMLFVFVSVFFLNGCGGGSSSSSSNSVLTNNVKLGPVRNATVTILTIDGVSNLYSTTTNDEGKYTIDINSLNSKLNEFTKYPEYLLITATGGEDIDYEDDGDNTNSAPVSVTGTVKGIFKTSTLLTQEELYINPISTAVAETLKDRKNIDETVISYTAKQIGVEDINFDGKIDNQDIIKYDMVEHASTFEETLKNNGFLGSIHNGDDSKIEEITKDFKEKYNLMFIDYSIRDGKVELKIEKSKSDSIIKYIVNAKQNDLFTNIYESSITLNQNDYVIYQECKDEECSPIQISSFDGEKVYQYFLRVSNFGIYSDVNLMNELRKKIIDDTKDLSDVNTEIEVQNSQLKIIDSDIDKLKTEIEQLNEKKYL